MSPFRILVDKEIRDLMDQATDEWGREAPMIQSMEECGEYIQAMAKTLLDKPRDHKNLIEEAADAIICIVHAMHELHTLPELEGWIAIKLEKFKTKLEG